jgi:hypothetical protein
MDMIQQIFAQAQAGSAQGEGFGQFAVQGAHLGQNQQRLNMAQREQDMLLPLRIKEMQANNLLLQFKAQEVDRMMTQRVQNEGAYQQLAQMLDERISAGEVATPETATALMAHMARFPGLMQDPRSQGLLKLYNDSMEMTLRLKQAGQGTQPEITQLTDPVSGKPVSVLRTGPNSFRELKGEGEEITFQSPDGQTVTLRRGGQAGRGTGDLTTANQTTAQQQLSGSIGAIDTINEMLPKINANTIGPIAAVESVLFDKLAANVPGLERLASKERADLKVMSKELRSHLFKKWRSDGNINKDEVASITRDIPDPNQPIASPQDAIHILERVQLGSARHALILAEKLQLPPPEAALQVLDDAELKQLNQSGVISGDYALKAYFMRHPELQQKQP